MFKAVRKIGLLGALVSAIAVVLVIGAVLQLTGKVHLFGSRRPAVSGNSYTKGEKTIPAGQVSTAKPSGTSTAASPTDNKVGGEKNNVGGGTNSTNLLEPSGSFVSNHHPALGDSISSVCTTTPGATCAITFTKDSVVKTLETRTTDRGGSAYWDWKVQDIGLTEGSWKIQAIATLNNQTKTTGDALAMEVSR